ncbi:Clusterin-associated protein-1-domain-containing protein [Paraphysoderma sedebokerense]|nr:Clusterin-associated protein-1-domain-containing protein [Paraphysoderma sedebokerense]
MSYRELKIFIEKMKALGYHDRVVSMESFKTPNFELIKELVAWMVHCYDASIELPMDTSTEQDRVIFVKSIAQLMATKAHIKLNTRKLYSADGYAVKELLKIASLLHDALKIVQGEDEIEDENTSSEFEDFNSKLSMIRTARQLAMEITEKGASLYDMLGKELELRDSRSRAISRQIDLPVIETAIKVQLSQVQDQIANTKAAIENLNADSGNLKSKIEKKKDELERKEKRLKSLMGVRPAFMDEFEKIEQELVHVYSSYIEKFRNMAYLEQQLEDYNRIDQDKQEESEITLKKMQSRIKEEELRLLRGDGELGGDFTIVTENGDDDGEEVMMKYDNDDLDSEELPSRKISGCKKTKGTRNESVQSVAMGSNDDLGIRNEDDEMGLDDDDDLFFRDSDLQLRGSSIQLSNPNVSDIASSFNRNLNPTQSTQFYQSNNRPRFSGRRSNNYRSQNSSNAFDIDFDNDDDEGYNIGRRNRESGEIDADEDDNESGGGSGAGSDNDF